MALILNMFVWALDAALLGSSRTAPIPCSARRFPPRRPEDAALPHLDLSGELDLHHQ